MPACQPSTTTQRARRGSTAPPLPAASSSSLPPPPSLSHVSYRRTHRGLLGRRLLGGRLGGGLLRDGLGSHCCFVELWGGWGDRPGRVGRVEMRVVGALYMNVAIERACGIICRPSEREIEGATRARLSRKTPSASHQSPRASDPLCACCKTPASRNIVSSCPHSWALPGAEISGSASAPPRAPAGRARARGEPDAEASALVEERAACLPYGVLRPRQRPVCVQQVAFRLRGTNGARPSPWHAAGTPRALRASTHTKRQGVGDLANCFAAAATAASRGGSRALQTCLKGWSKVGSRVPRTCGAEGNTAEQRERSSRGGGGGGARTHDFGLLAFNRRPRPPRHGDQWINVFTTAPAAVSIKSFQQCSHTAAAKGRRKRARQIESEGRARRQRMHTSKHKENNCTHASAQRGFSLSAASYLYN